MVVDRRFVLLLWISIPKTHLLLAQLAFPQFEEMLPRTLLLADEGPSHERPARAARDAGSDSRVSVLRDSNDCVRRDGCLHRRPHSLETVAEAHVADAGLDESFANGAEQKRKAETRHPGSQLQRLRP